MYETGFQIGIISTAKVVCGPETRDSQAKSIQPGIMKGKALHPQVILSGKHHQSSWFLIISKEKAYRLKKPPHSSHLLQLLDVSCFGPLRHFYGQRIQEMAHYGVNTVDKMDFLSVNVSSRFRATSLIPLNPEKVISKLVIKLKLQELQNQAFYAEQTLEEVIKGCETAMQNTKKKKKKQIPYYFIQEEGSLTVKEALQKREEAEPLTASSSRRRGH
ncbi:hypothetical protein BDV12DRAFT_181713 [Aspergillus spectabilis]